VNNLRKLRQGRPGDILNFSDKNGRTAAKALLLIQEPTNSGAAASGVVDRDNKYESARLFKALNEELGFDRENGLSRAKPVCKARHTYTYPQHLQQ
jgi:hypothetical protein